MDITLQSTLFAYLPSWYMYVIGIQIPKLITLLICHKIMPILLRRSSLALCPDSHKYNIITLVLYLYIPSQIVRIIKTLFSCYSIKRFIYVLIYSSISSSRHITTDSNIILPSGVVWYGVWLGGKCYSKWKNSGHTYTCTVPTLTTRITASQVNRLNIKKKKKKNIMLIIVY